ncbi:MAG: D-2-hydroxyacid dehydrogenase [Ktedonobacteraceae bacterium]
MSRIVLISAPIEQDWVERLKRVSPDLTIEKVSSLSSQDERWQEVEIIYGVPWKLPKLEQVPHLRWIQLYSAGADRLVTTPLFQADIMITTASGVHAINIAEYVFTMTQAWYRQLPQLLVWKQRKEWGADKESTKTAIEELHGKTIGIVGYGSIGRQIARLAQAYGMRILAMQRGNNHKDSGFSFPDVGDPEGTLPQRYYTFDQLHDMLQECDIVVVAVPLTAETKAMFNTQAFQAMKNSAFFVNIARGDICDEAALIHALEQKHIAGAALDVFEQEPLPSTSPLWDLPNVLMSPHNSGVTPHYNERAATIFEENLRRYLAGHPMYNLVDKQRGY